MKTLRVKLNINGNYVVFIGTERHIDFAQEWDVINYLSGLLQSFEYRLSKKSDITLAQINNWRIKVDLNPL